MIFTESAPLGQFSHIVAMSACVSVCAIGCSFFQGSTFYNSKTQMWQQSKCDKTAKKNQIAPQLKNSKCYKTQSVKWQNLKFQMVNPLKTEIVVKFKQI